VSYAPEVAPRAARRWPRRLAISIVVVLGLLVAADRIALVITERLAATAFQNSQDLSQRPSVSVHGFPFLTQLAAEDFGDVQVQARGLTIEKNTRLALPVAQLDVTLHHLTIVDGFSTVKVQSATATALVDYDDLSHTLGVQIGYGGQVDGVGRVEASGTVTVAGQSVTARVTAGVAGSSARGLSFTDPQVVAGGVTIPPSLLGPLTGVFNRDIPFGTLPFGVRLDSMTATANGLVADLSARDLVYHRH
jgi:hypothetical protein